MRDRHALGESEIFSTNGTLLHGGPGSAGLLGRAKESYQHYQELFNGEVKYLKANQRYPKSRYRLEKEWAADRVIAELEKLRTYSAQNTYGKIKKLAEVGAAARRVAVLTTGVSPVLVIALSF